jgi:hypothetical protein
MFNNKPIFGWSLLPVCLTVVLFGLWRFSQIPFLAWLGVVTAIMGMALPVVALIVAMKDSPDKVSAERIRTLVIQSALTGLSVVICWSSFQLFSSISAKNTRMTKTVVIKNLSDQPIKDISVNYAGQTVKINKIPGYGRHELQIQILAETVFKASIKDSANTERSSQILIGPENNYVQVLVDLQQNIMAEVQ